MPFVIKHRTEDRYLCGSRSRRADHDPNGLVSMEFARIFPTESGAKTALRSWASKWDYSVRDTKREGYLRSMGADSTTIEISCQGRVVPDEAKLAMVEIVPIKMGPVI